MSKFSKEAILDYADKLLIGLDEEEINLILNEFDIIDYNMELITKIKDIAKVEPMTYALDNFNYELTLDEPEESPKIEELLQNCDVYEGREVEVPLVVGGEDNA